MTTIMWLLLIAVTACACLHFSPPGGVRELLFASITLAAVIAVPVVAGLHTG